MDPAYGRFLRLSNGGYTPDLVYHFFGSYGVLQHSAPLWNNRDLWKDFYGLSDDHFVIAENVIGNQYIYYHSKRRKVMKCLIMDTGQLLPCADSFSEWAEGILDEQIDPTDSNTEILRARLSRFIAHSGEAYEMLHHLGLAIPLCVGGVDSLENLEFIDSAVHMSTTGQLLRQTRG